MVITIRSHRHLPPVNHWGGDGWGLGLCVCGGDDDSVVLSIERQDPILPQARGADHRGTDSLPFDCKVLQAK